jgi:methyl-accepting chemotaxis protein
MREVELRGIDEVERLSAAFNAMAKKVREARLQLVREKESVEEQVRRAVAESEKNRQALHDDVVEMIAVMDRFASGDLTVRMPHSRNEEVNLLAESFNEAIVRISALLGEIQHIMHSTTQAVHHIAEQTRELSVSSHEQAQQVQRSTGTASQSVDALRQRILSTKEIAHTAATNNEIAGKGAEVLTHTLETVRNFSGLFTDIANKIQTLESTVDTISTITNTINDIAARINLLALNASIEAARAGEYGRGFAVVADEVRKLAEKTMTATKEVGQAIHGIQLGARKNIDNVSQAARAMEDMSALADKSGEALGHIVTLVDLAANQVGSIATAAEQQSATSEEINRSIEGVNRIAAETADAMRQSASAVAELARQAQILKTLIEDMKPEGSAG